MAFGSYRQGTPLTLCLSRGKAVRCSPRTKTDIFSLCAQECVRLASAPMVLALLSGEEGSEERSCGPGSICQ